MLVSVITPFPELLEPFTRSGVIGKAVDKGLISIRCLNPRDFADGHYGQIDDYAYGSGGMVLMAEPLARAVEAAGADAPAYVIHPGPQGVLLGQHVVESLASMEHLVIVCGRYEGVDERFLEKFVDLEVSIGDYVLTGGEIPAMVIIDAVSRLIPGVVGQECAVREDSFFRGMLDTPHYTRPASWRDVAVPEVLAGGDHGEIRAWRRRQSVARTLGRRPDVIARANIGPYLDKGVYVILVPAKDAVRNEDAVGLCLSYGCERLLLVSGGSRNGEESEAGAGKGAKTFPTLEKALAWIRKREKEQPLAILGGGSERGRVHWLEAKRRSLSSGKPLVFVIGSGKEEFDPAGVEVLALGPVRGGKGDEPISAPRDTLAVLLDRFFGWR
jgi:tRNA (guanine37-N1)-methyltransferase